MARRSVADLDFPTPGTAVRASRPLVLAAAGALLLTACGGGDGVDIGGGGGAARGDDVLVAAVSAQPDQFDPHVTSAYPSFQVLENVYDTLVVPHAEDLTMEPSLAESWETSEDGLTWTFALREGVTFHDGSNFDAADVVYSYRRIIDEELANSYRFASVRSVEAPDAQTVVLGLTRPTPNLLSLIGAFKGMAILPEGAARDLDLTTEANGTGPFQLESSDASSTVLTAYGDHWGGAPGIDGVEFRYITEPAAALTSLRDGEVEWTDNVPPRQVESLSHDEDVELARTPSVDYWYMSMNYAREPFGNPQVRQAIATAVDRAEVTEAARVEAARPNQTAIPEGSFFHQEYAPFEPDEDAARALLEEAGVSTPITMGLMVTDEFPESVTAAQVIAGQLEPIGITVEVEVLDFVTWLDRQDQGNFDALMLSWLGNIDPADFYEAQHITDGSSNYQGYSNPEVDRLLTEAATETDQDARKELYGQAAKLIVDDVSYLYLYNPDVVQAWVPGLEGYRIRADRAINFEEVELP
ncbi:MAG: Dipeptide-binding ABC transporter, periplasmic substrate-binding component [uncultured Blastococcus sp.]|uniref:Dipeptide-binding ABC transporter, periplasmic substrate-binding component n=1 Tax=uncultured Blastococcus sp. TaxID=217144 RepID=A0A6J4H1Q2_9ACTN|nr:MAG: Dipeptide-binding ABC transporter, periplasmic substrate-binding component [uncultured Blastococcus sp.]